MSLKQRWSIIVLIIAIAIFAIIPNFLETTEESREHWYFKNQMTYGLDIQGGLHLVLGVDMDASLQDRMRKYLSSFKDNMKEKIVSSEVVDSSKLLIKFKKATNITEFNTFLDENYPGLFFIDPLGAVDVHIYFTEVWKGQLKTQIVEQSVEVIRNRVDEFGVSEPMIAPQGRDRIVVQLPGVASAASAKALIQKAAKLEFRPFHQKNTELDLDNLIKEVEKKEKFTFKSLPYSQYIQKINLALKSKLPKDSQIIFEQMEGAKTLDAGRVPVLIDLSEKVGGDLLEGAQVGFNEYGKPQVVFRLSPAGRRGFADLSGNHIDEQVAIILDQVVKSAPMVRERIDSATAEITLGSGGNYEDDFKEAQLIATALRAGALPADLTELQERTVGPSLGKLALDQGKMAAIVGAILLVVFLIIYYGVLGFVTSFTLVLNMVFLVAILGGFKATLTLPGIVGFLLTVGMAVDANVIIFERIKEELRKGSSWAFSVKEGFEKAFSSIFDSNITTIMVCVILMYLGSGPIKGFAVTLSAGVLISMFTALFVSRTIIITLLQKYPSIKWGVRL